MTATSQRAIVITAVVAIFLALITSSYFTYKQKQAHKKVKADAFKGFKRSPKPDNMRPDLSHKQENSRQKRGGLASALLPYYGILVMVFFGYIVRKMMKKQYSGLNKPNDIKVSWRKKQRSKGNSKTKITMYELTQLEQRLQETEAAVKHILEQACIATDMTSQVLNEECSNSDESFSVRSKKRREEPLTSDSDYDERYQGRNFKNPTMDGVTNLRLRKWKPTKKKIKRRSQISQASHKSSSEVESDDISSDEQPSFGHGTTDIPEPGTRLNDTNHEDHELLQTAKTIHATMSDLQSYITERKLEMSTEE